MLFFGSICGWIGTGLFCWGSCCILSNSSFISTVGLVALGGESGDPMLAKLLMSEPILLVILYCNSCRCGLDCIGFSSWTTLLGMHTDRFRRSEKLWSSSWLSESSLDSLVLVILLFTLHNAAEASQLFWLLLSTLPETWIGHD